MAVTHLYGVKLGAAAVMLKQNLHVRLLTKSNWSEYIILVAEQQHPHGSRGAHGL